MTTELILKLPVIGFIFYTIICSSHQYELGQELFPESSGVTYRGNSTEVFSDSSLHPDEIGLSMNNPMVDCTDDTGLFRWQDDTAKDCDWVRQNNVYGVCNDEDARNHCPVACNFCKPLIKLVNQIFPVASNEPQQQSAKYTARNFYSTDDIISDQTDIQSRKWPTNNPSKKKSYDASIVSFSCYDAIISFESDEGIMRDCNWVGQFKSLGSCIAPRNRRYCPITCDECSIRYESETPPRSIFMSMIYHSPQPSNSPTTPMLLSMIHHTPRPSTSLTTFPTMRPSQNGAVSTDFSPSNSPYMNHLNDYKSSRPSRGSTLAPTKINTIMSTQHPSSENQTAEVLITKQNNDSPNQNKSQFSLSTRNISIIVVAVVISGSVVLIFALWQQALKNNRLRLTKGSTHPIVDWPLSNHPVVDWPSSPNPTVNWPSSNCVPTVDWPSSNGVPTVDWPRGDDRRQVSKPIEKPAHTLSIYNGLNSPDLKTILWPTMRSP